MIKKLILIFIILLITAIAGAQEQNTKDTLVMPQRNDAPPLSFFSVDGKPAGIILTAEEKAWIEKHPSSNLGCNTTFPPFSFIEENNVPTGMAMDYLEIIKRHTGINIQITQKGTLEKLFSLVKEKQIDGILFHIKTPEREQNLNFTKPYIDLDWIVVTRNDYPFVGSIGDLNPKFTTKSFYKMITY